MNTFEPLKAKLRNDTLSGLIDKYPRPRDDLLKQLQQTRCISKNNEYEIIDVLGEGATSITCKGVSLSGQKVAAKILFPARTICSTEEEYDRILSRFISEALNGQELNHPNLVSIFDIAITESEGKNHIAGRPCCIMELVEGISLSEILQNSKIRLSERLNILSQIASAIEYLHLNGTFHRDIKPQNIILTDDFNKAVLCDLGVAKWPDSENILKLISTGSTEHLTTWKYMPPETEVNAKNYDAKSDIWSFGVTAAELLSEDFIPRVLFFASPSPRGNTLPHISRILSKMTSFHPWDRLDSNDLKEIFCRYYNFALNFESLDPKNIHCVIDKIAKIRNGPGEYFRFRGTSIKRKYFVVPEDLKVPRLNFDKFNPLWAPNHSFSFYDFPHYLTPFYCPNCGGNLIYECINFWEDIFYAGKIWFCLGTSDGPCGKMFLYGWET